MAVVYPNRQALIDAGADPAVVDAAIAEADRRASGLVAESPKRKPAHRLSVMNQTEARFARLLDAGRWIAPVARWAFEPEVLELAPDMTYCPDFRLDLEDGSIDCVDCKGKHTFEDSVIKGKAASVIIPGWRFYLATLKYETWLVRRMGVKGRKTIKIPVMEYAK
jgi:hypothetical protein